MTNEVHVDIFAIDSNIGWPQMIGKAYVNYDTDMARWLRRTVAVNSWHSAVQYSGSGIACGDFHRLFAVDPVDESTV